MSHINRENDHNHEAFLEGYECGQPSSSEKSVPMEEYKRYKILYDLFKNIVEISPIDNKSCATNCPFINEYFLNCRLFDSPISNYLRCSKCMEVFIDE